MVFVSPCCCCFSHATGPGRSTRRPSRASATAAARLVTSSLQLLHTEDRGSSFSLATYRGDFEAYRANPCAQPI
jgi:hypothetical protein